MAGQPHGGARRRDQRVRIHHYGRPAHLSRLSDSLTARIDNNAIDDGFQIGEHAGTIRNLADRRARPAQEALLGIVSRAPDTDARGRAADRDAAPPRRARG